MARLHVGIRNGAILLSGAVLAFFAGRDALVFASAGSSPGYALLLSPTNGVANSRVFDQLLAKEKLSESDMPAWGGVARAVLRTAPLDAPMIRILAMASEGAAVGDLMRLSERVSRRDLLTQLWLIEDAVAQNDVAAALRHYDRALSVFPAAGNNLYEILSSSMEHDEVRAELAIYVKAGRPWVNGFLSYAVQHSAQPALVADLLAASGGSRDSAPHRRAIETRLLAKLVTVGEVSTARSHARRMGAENPILSDFAMTPLSVEPSYAPLGWTLASNASGHGALDEAGALRVTVSPAVRGRIAQRVVQLAPGGWSLAHSVEFPSLSPMASLTWQIFCVTSAAKQNILDQALPSQASTQAYRINFDVPTDCQGVEFILMARGGDAQIEASAIVTDLKLRQIR